jgi:predicted RND superfamily exporter protein
MIFRFPKSILVAFALLAALGGFLALNRLQFSFNFEDFFPTDDPDLKYFQEFKQRFEPDDNFLLIALHRPQGVFEQGFLRKVQSFTEKVSQTEFPLKRLAPTDSLDGENFYKKPSDKGDSILYARPIRTAQSILQVEYPLKSPIGFVAIPAVHLEEPERYAEDQAKLLSDDRFAGTLLSKDGKTLVVALKTVDNIQQEVAEKLMASIHQLLAKEGLNEYHILGRANFQTEIVELQTKEFILSCVVSFFLVLGIMFFIFRKFWGVLIAASSIVMGLSIFVGALGLLGATLDTMALLYPIVMIIVATSDVVHVMTKYTDELKKGLDKKTAMQVTLREIGLSVFLTSATTAIGFASLFTSRVAPIKYFGLYAAMGVLLAYFTVIFFTTSFLLLFDRNQIIQDRKTFKDNIWYRSFDRLYHFTKDQAKWIGLGTLLLLALCAWGISKVHTNTVINNILPKGTKVRADFLFFEQQFSGFRPFEIAIEIQGDNTAEDYAVLERINALEQELKRYPAIQSINSITTLYKSLHRAYNGDNAEYYIFPPEEDFDRYGKWAKKLAKSGNLGLLVSKDKKHARISARLLDVGADSIARIQSQIDAWMAKNIPQDLLKAKQTGTGVIVDKNSEYVRDSLLWGLSLSILVIALVMAFLYRNIKMLLVFLIPNTLPMILAAAIIGFGDIALEAGVAIVFGIIFGISVDDTIHMLGRYRLLRQEGQHVEAALHTMLTETGKAITLTSLILFCGFLILLFSSNPPAVTVGSLISATLFSALAADVFLLPPLLRWLDRSEQA